jgi:hypothetical protein
VRIRTSHLLADSDVVFECPVTVIRGERVESSDNVFSVALDVQSSLFLVALLVIDPREDFFVNAERLLPLQGVHRVVCRAFPFLRLLCSVDLGEFGIEKSGDLGSVVSDLEKVDVFAECCVLNLRKVDGERACDDEETLSVLSLVVPNLEIHQASAVGLSVRSCPGRKSAEES